MNKAAKTASITLELTDWLLLWVVLYDASRDRARAPSQCVAIERIQEAIRQATRLDLSRETVDAALAATSKDDEV
jgi:hypothetical protein